MIRLVTLIKILLTEGGNVFGTTSSIKREYIEPTLREFVRELSNIFKNKAKTFNSFEKLGSAGKKDLSGDIDLSYNVDNLVERGQPDLNGWGLDPTQFKTTYDSIRKRARTATEAQSTVRAMLILIAEKINRDSTILQADPKSAGSNSIFLTSRQYNEKGEALPETVQIDINVGNPEWLRFSYYSNAYKGAVKGLHRTQLVLALFTAKGKMFKHERGVLDKETREVEANTPQEAIDLLNNIYNFKTPINQAILNDYFKLSDFLKQNTTPQEFDNIMSIYLKILDTTGPYADIPEDLQPYWLENREKLNLTGKRLPDNSNLKKYV